ncbi:DUF6338 family protein [Ensifer sesbaniae]|uniref:DUF6338 family protein n=1 Tax=Ensifer sesbaniae TaxID=1214071 RepID=UPI001569E72C|nr:DUF6338 family protein [Ensifer sesbaniae]NRQ15589.1 hypothetical protein [Ensifer sesbaniae]
MDTLLKMPIEFQIVLVAGYIAYKIVTVGRNRNHRTEDFLLQVLTFGLIARAVVATAFWVPNTIPKNDSINAALVAGLTVMVAIGLGAAWRAFGERCSHSLMKTLRVYRDDHEASVWQSIMHNPAEWTVLQVHLDDGTVLEANFGQMKPRPKTAVFMNEDGIGLYVTGRYDAENNFAAFDITGNDADVTLTYIPRASVKRVDVNWRLPPAQIKREFPIS